MKKGDPVYRKACGGVLWRVMEVCESGRVVVALPPFKVSHLVEADELKTPQEVDQAIIAGSARLAEEFLQVPAIRVRLSDMPPHVRAMLEGLRGDDIQPPDEYFLEKEEKERGAMLDSALHVANWETP